jgi:hypothetical protein
MEEAWGLRNKHMAKNICLKVAKFLMMTAGRPSTCYLIKVQDQLCTQPHFRHEVITIFTAFFENSKNYFKPNPS